MDQSTARIGDHGELTIPKSVRDRVGLAPGVEVDFVVEDARLRLVRVDRPQDPGPMRRRGVHGQRSPALRAAASASPDQSNHGPPGRARSIRTLLSTRYDRWVAG